VSYSLAIANGDLVQKGSRLDVVYGIDKMKQDVNCWLLERFGGDRFHVNYGSILQEFIGGIASESIRVEVQAEIFRVLQNYQSMQLRRFKENPEKLSGSELLVSIDNISVGLNYDTIRATLRLRNGSNQHTTINLTTST
jgi:phage baseplate assembly protein W